MIIIKFTSITIILPIIKEINYQILICNNTAIAACISHMDPWVVLREAKGVRHITVRQNQGELRA